MSEEVLQFVKMVREAGRRSLYLYCEQCGIKKYFWLTRVEGEVEVYRCLGCGGEQWYTVF